jgi:hypothetical protein
MKTAETNVNLRFNLYGNKCNEYPHLTILHNQQVKYSGPVTESLEIELNIVLQKDNVITLDGINKSEGQDGKWDTKVDENGQIIADKWLEINNIWVDNISMGHEWIQSLTIVHNNNSKKFLARTFWNNGSVSFLIQEPLLDWIIQEKFINAEQQDIAHETSMGRSNIRFGYTYIQEKIKLVRTILND